LRRCCEIDLILAGLRNLVATSRLVALLGPLAVLLVPVSDASSRTREKIPVQTFFGNPARTAYRISPDGKTLSFLQEWHSHLNIFVEPIAGGKKTRLTSESTMDILQIPHAEAQFDAGRRVTSLAERDVPPDYFWKGNHYIVFRKDNHGNEQFHFYRVDVTKSDANAEAEDLTPFPNVRSALVDDLEGVSDTDILIALNRRDPHIFDVCRVNVVDADPNKIDMVVKNTLGAIAWMVDHDGRVRVAITREGTQTTLCTRLNETCEFKPVCTTDFTDSIVPQCYTADNKLLYAISNINRDKAALVLIDPETGKEVGAPLYEHPEFDLDRLEFSKTRNIATHAEYFDWKLQRRFFDKRTEKIFDVLDRRFPNSVVRFTGHDLAEEKFIVATSQDRAPGARYLFDSRTNDLRKLADVVPALKQGQLSPMKAIQYPNDGVMIHGYLTLPLKRGHRRLPAVIYPHSGPWARDSWGYNPDVQFLANRGYAVLQMNFRGSLGYGKDFWKAGFKQWGGKMQCDITAGVKWLLNSGLIDPARIAIYGESYGGYAALNGITFTPNLYAAGADRAGITNLLNFLETLPAYWGSLLPELYAKIGDPRTDGPLLAAQSPLLHVDQIKAPLLISHGAGDVRVNCLQSEELVAALQKRGLNPEYLPFDGEGHDFENEAKVAFHEKLDAFLEEYLKPQHP